MASLISYTNRLYVMYNSGVIISAGFIGGFVQPFSSLEEDIMREEKFKVALGAARIEYNKARKRFRKFRSWHEGIAVLEEEFLELRDAVFHSHDPERMWQEAIQTAAMALALATECGKQPQQEKIEILFPNQEKMRGAIRSHAEEGKPHPSSSVGSRSVKKERKQ